MDFLIAMAAILALLVGCVVLPVRAWTKIGLLVVSLSVVIAFTPSLRFVMRLVGVMFGVIPSPLAEIYDPSPPPDTDIRVTLTYRVEAAIRVDGELRLGSSIQRVTIVSNSPLDYNAHFPAYSSMSIGEGVAIPLSDDDYVLITMATAPGHRDYDAVLVSPCGKPRRRDPEGRTTGDDYLANARSFSGTCEVSASELPRVLLVHNASKPEGFVELTAQSMPEVLGDGSELVFLKLTKVTEPLQFALPGVFAWIPPESPTSENIQVPFMTDSGLGVMYITDIISGYWE